MTEEELKQIIEKLKQNDELPYIEAKVNLSDLDQIGKTISALANSASWKNEEYGYLIFGLKDKTWEVVGSSTKLENIKQGGEDGNLWLKKNGFDYKCDFEEYGFEIENKRIYALKIKNCENKPLYFLGTREAKSTAYIREGQNNNLLQNFPDRLISICSKKPNFDWSAQICEAATIEALDEKALVMARNNFIVKNLQWKSEAQNWSTELFLKKAKILKDGKITNSVILLLGKRESVRLLKNCHGGTEISWKEIIVKPKAELFELPFVIAIPNLIEKITVRTCPKSFS